MKNIFYLSGLQDGFILSVSVDGEQPAARPAKTKVRAEGFGRIVVTNLYHGDYYCRMQSVSGSAGDHHDTSRLRL